MTQGGNDEEGEITVFGGRIRARVERGEGSGLDPELKFVSAEAYRELVIHTLLRGAETLAIYSGGAEIPDDYPIDRREMGQKVRNIVDVQAGYNEVLRFQPFLERSVPLKLGHDGVPNEPGAEWSGHGNGEASLVRTVAFGAPERRSIWLYGRPVELPFERRGQWFWVFPNGTVRAVDPAE